GELGRGGVEHGPQVLGTDPPHQGLGCGESGGLAAANRSNCSTAKP
ncbi:MAG: hypothetical protein RIR28_1218, partial [Pseudomonadota bacterium]